MHRPTTLCSRLDETTSRTFRFGLALSWVAVAVAVPVRVAAQDVHRVTVESQDWTIARPTPASESLEPEPCAVPCAATLPAGEVALSIAEPDAPRSRHRRTFTLAFDAHLRVTRWSHSDERTAGGWILGLGGVASLGMVIGGAAALGAASSSSSLFAGVGEAALMGSGAGLLVFFLCLGIPLAIWPDEPVLEVTRVGRLEPMPLEVDRSTREQRHIAIALAVSSGGLLAGATALIIGGMDERGTTLGTVLSSMGGIVMPLGVLGLAISAGLELDVSSRRSAWAPRTVAFRMAPGPGDLGLGAALDF